MGSSDINVAKPEPANNFGGGGQNKVFLIEKDIFCKKKYKLKGLSLITKN